MSILQSPYQGLDGYKNTCWMSRLPANLSQVYKGNAYNKALCTGQADDTCQADFNYMVTYWNRIYLKQNQAAVKPSKGHEPYRMRCLPYVYFVGVTKSGTSDFFDKFVKHPSVVKPSMKEPMYFNWNRLISKYN